MKFHPNTKVHEIAKHEITRIFRNKRVRTETRSRSKSRLSRSRIFRNRDFFQDPDSSTSRPVRSPLITLVQGGL